MAQQSRADLTPQFENNDFPTGEDFKNLIDSAFNKVDDANMKLLSVSKADGVVAIDLVNGLLTYGGLPIASWWGGRFRVGDFTDPEWYDDGENFIQTNGAIRTGGFSTNIRTIYDVASIIQIDDNILRFGNGGNQYTTMPPTGSHGREIFIMLLNGTTLTVSGNGNTINGSYENLIISDPGYMYGFKLDIAIGDWVFIGKTSLTL